MKGFLILMVTGFFSVGAFGQHSTINNTVHVHEWIKGNWIEHDTALLDSSEIIHKMLIGTWVDSNFRAMGVTGSYFAELKIYKDSIISIYKYRPSEHQIVANLLDGDYASKHKDDKPDTILRIEKERYKYKILYVDETRNNSSFIGYSIEVPYEDTTNINDNIMDHFNEAMISLISDKHLAIEGMWCPCINAPTEVYKKEN